MNETLITTKDNWLYFPDNMSSPIVNKYPIHEPYHSLSEAAIAQAKSIYNDYKDRRIVILVSGGLDSQLAAFAFSKANLPVKYLYFNVTLENRPEKERIYVDEFVKKHEIDLEIMSLNFSKMELKNFFINEKYHPREMLAGFSIFRKLFKDYLETYSDTLFVRSTVPFYYLREGGTCFGTVQIGNDFLDKIPNYSPQHVSFEFYTTHLYEYYESLHRKNKLLQFQKKFQPKNFAYTELGFDLREKTATPDWFDNDFHQPSRRTRIDFADDNSLYLLKDLDRNILKHIFDHSDNEADSIMTKYNVIRRKNSEYYKRYPTNLYSFDTDVWKYDL